MSRKARVLFSSRDPGSVGHIAALVSAFRNDGRFEVDLVASGPALKMLRQAGAAARAFTFARDRDSIEIGEDPASLLEGATDLLRELRPDAVFVGLSSFGVGVDEALLATARVPTFAMQDFWGDVNLSLQVPARLYFVLDEEAAVLTRRRWGVHALAVGSPKHARYAGLDIAGSRQSAREALGARSNEKVIGFFAQSPAIPGHEQAFRDLIGATAMLKPRPILLLRAHPKFDTACADHIALAARQGLQVRDVTGKGDVEAWLACCDAVTTAFSASAIDHAYLSAHSPVPIGTVLYLLPNDDIRNFAQRACGMKYVPLVDRGMGQVAEEPDEVFHCLERALSVEDTAAYFKASKSLGTKDPSPKIMEKVEESLSIGAGIL